MHYSDPKPRANEDWLCNKCGVQNFKRREKCFKCCVPKSEAELKLPQLQQDLIDGQQNNGVEGLLPVPAQYQTSGLSAVQGQATQHQSDATNDTLILRNLGQYSSVDAILAALSPFATLSPSNIRLIKDKHTNLNRGFAFLQLSTIVEASQLLQILQALQPPLSIDGKAIVVEFAKGSKRDVFLTDGNKVSAATVASTAIAAAQWAVTQNASGGGSGGPVFQQAAAVAYNQEGFSAPDGTIFNAQAHSGLTVMPTKTPETYTDAETTEGALIQTAVPISTAATTLTTQVVNVGTNIPSQPATPGTEHEQTHYPIPDTSTYQYDESSGYYYDPFTGLYYDANSQYYFNPHTQQYMYWDGEKHTYIPADDQSSSANADTESKDKKEKNKSKTAQQIAKDMERWAKSLNRHKENMRSSSGSAALARGRFEDQKESASADAGYAVLEKKGALLERPQINLEQMRQSTEIHQRGLVPAYDGEADSDEEAVPKDEREDRITDWSKLACLLCQRQFPSKEALIRHQQLSELHKQNLEQRRILPAQEKLTNGFQPPDLKKRKIDGVMGVIPGVRMLK